MAKAGELVDTDQWIIEVKSLEKEINSLKARNLEYESQAGDFIERFQKMKDKLEVTEGCLHALDLQEMVRQFHLKFNFTANPVNENPTLIPLNLAIKRLGFLWQEVKELEEAEYTKDIVKIADALGDITYFIYGNAVAYGIPLAKVFAEIHRSNMTKSSCLDKDGKAVKGPNYSPPDIKSAIYSFSKES